MAEKINPSISTNFNIPNSSGTTAFMRAREFAYGELYVKDNTTETTLNSADKVQVTDFDTNGNSLNCTPDQSNSYITIKLTGKYLITLSIAIVSSAGAAHIISVGIFKNAGVTQYNNVHGHRTMGNGTDTGSLSLSGIIDVTAGDTIELWANTSSGSNRDVIFQDVNFSLVRLSA